MAITYRGASNAAGQALGSAAASTVSVTPTLPSGATSGDRIFIIQCCAGTPGSTPASWTSLGTFTIGSGTAASGSGLRRTAVYYRDYDGVWSMPAVTETSVANNSNWVGAVAITRTSGSYTWNTPTISTVGGAFNTATTAYTDTSAAAFTTHSGGFLITGTCLNDNVTSTSPAITQTGATIGTVTERCDGGTSTGFVVAGQIHTASITTGAAATITQTQTLSAASQGETVFIEQTETPPAAAISTLADDFNTGSTPDAGKWTTPVGSASLSSGELVLAANSELDSLVAYNLTGDAAYVKVPAATTGSYFSILGGGDADWFFTSSSVASVQIGFTATGTTRAHTAGDWYRIRESGGTIFWDYSTNGTSWTNLYSATVATVGITTSSVTVALASGASGTPHFDNFNTAPAATNTGAFFAMF